MNIVLDTSVLIDAFYHPPDRPTFTKDVYDYAVAFHQAWVSDEILKEFRNKCLKKLKLNSELTHRLESLIKKKAHYKPVQFLKFDPEALHSIKLRDKKDVHVIHFALGIPADIILTWDKDLLVLERIGKVNILSPRAFWDRFIV